MNIAKIKRCSQPADPQDNTGQAFWAESTPPKSDGPG
jgi:hypothetical protein